mgnify:CR=1 FL=1
MLLENRRNVRKEFKIKAYLEIVLVWFTKKMKHLRFDALDEKMHVCITGHTPEDVKGKQQQQHYPKWYKYIEH